MGEPMTHNGARIAVGAIDGQLAIEVKKFMELQAEPDASLIQKGRNAGVADVFENDILVFYNEKHGSSATHGRVIAACNGFGVDIEKMPGKTREWKLELAESLLKFAGAATASKPANKAVVRQNAGISTRFLGTQKMRAGTDIRAGEMVYVGFPATDDKGVPVNPNFGREGDRVPFVAKRMSVQSHAQLIASIVNTSLADADEWSRLMQNNLFNNKALSTIEHFRSALINQTLINGVNFLNTCFEYGVIAAGPLTDGDPTSPIPRGPVEMYEPIPGVLGSSSAAASWQPVDLTGSSDDARDRRERTMLLIERMMQLIPLTDGAGTIHRNTNQVVIQNGGTWDNISKETIRKSVTDPTDTSAYFGYRQNSRTLSLKPDNTLDISNPYGYSLQTKLNAVAITLAAYGNVFMTKVGNNLIGQAQESCKSGDWTNITIYPIAPMQ